MENTYWNHKGRHERHTAALYNLVEEKLTRNKEKPHLSKVMGGENRCLEKSRKASLCYYDLYNNGGCNRGDEIRALFGIKLSQHNISYWSAHSKRMCNRLDFAAIEKIVEPQIDKIILMAAVEQDLEF